MIIVFGSVNVDITTRVERLPKPGETVRGSDCVISPGGKGANQALAARRMGADVLFVGAVGKDVFASNAIRLLKGAGVDLSHLLSLDVPTGAAFITVNANGENCIVLSPGANALVRAQSLSAIPAKEGDVLLLQGEITLIEIAKAIEWGRQRNLTTILNLAPAFSLPAEYLHKLDVLVVNDVESRFLANSVGVSDEPTEFTQAMARGFELTAIVTLGRDGAVAHDGRELRAQRAFPVSTVDTTGAGDTFVGAIAALFGKESLDETLHFASAAAALACTRLGAQVSVPRVEEVRAFLACAR
jgi:ribokinase